MQKRVLYAVSCTILILAYGALAHAITLSVSSEEGAPGDTVVVKINIDNTNGIASLGIKPFEYDANILTVKEVKATPLIAGLALQTSNTDTPGVINLAAVGFQALGEGSGAIYEITFEVKADAPPGAKSQLTVGKAFLSDLLGKDLPATIENGEFTVAGGEEPKPPQAIIKAPEKIMAGKEVEFDGSGSTDEDGTIEKWQWAFGDGKTGEGDKAKNTYEKGGTYTVKLTVTDNDGLTGEVEIKVTVAPKLPEVIKAHKDGSPMLALEVDFKDEKPASCSVNIWEGELKIENGMYLEYQCAVFSGNPAFNAGIDLQTSDGTLSATDAKDQNGLSASPKTDLSAKIKVGAKEMPAARDVWYHRQISLDALAGKTVVKITLATDSETHRVGKFRFYVDNVQITNGKEILKAIYIDGDDGNDILTGKQKVPEDANDCYVKVGIKSVGVQPAGKLSTTWGRIKKLLIRQ